MRDQRIRLGEVGVDSGQLLVIDPCYLEGWDHDAEYERICELTLPPKAGGELTYPNGASGRGVAFPSGYGDGSYPVWATVRDGRVVSVEIDLLGEVDDGDLD